MKPSKFLLFPFKNGEWLRNSQGNPRVYKTISGALRNLKKEDYDSIVVYSDIADYTREQFESLGFDAFDGSEE